MTGAAIVPPAEGGYGRFTWDESRVMSGTYHIRVGHQGAVRIMFGSLIAPSQRAAVLNDICQILDNHQGDTP